VKWTRTETKEHIFLTPGEFRESLTLMPEHFHAFIEFLVEAVARSTRSPVCVHRA
jgi:hypothetical protein